MTDTVAGDGAPTAQSLGLPLPRRTVAVACVLTSMSLVVLDAGMANVALPSMARSLRAEPATERSGYARAHDCASVASGVPLQVWQIA